MQGPRLSRRRIAPSSLRPWWLLGALVSWVSPAQAQLGGTCAEAISVLPSSVTEGPPAHAGTQLETIWYKLSGTGRSVLVDAESTGTRPRIVAYEGDCSELEARGSWLPPFSFVIATVAGGRHFINVARWPSVTYTLRLTELSRPANDDCEDSIVLDLTSQNPVEVEGTNLSATTEGSRMSMGAPGVWYRVIGNGHRFRASICDDSNFTPSVVVFRGYCDNLQRLDTSTPFQCTRPSSVAEWPSAPGQVYSILVEGMIDAHGPAQGVFKLSVSFIVPPPADCDRDGISDADEIRAGAIDCDRNLIPDSCELATTARFGPVQDWFVNAYEHPVAVIASDFDGDGRQDLAAASVESFDDRVPAAPGVLVLRNAPATGFTLVQALKVPALVSGRSIFSPRLVAADLDGDHHVDLALTGGKYPAVAILRNLGDGHMEPSGVYDKETSSEEAIRFLGRGDLDLDGDVDLFTTEENHTRIRILWNDGHARFDAAGFIPVDRMPLADAVAADLDGDGQTDLAALAALSPGDRVVQVLRNDGGAFSPASRLALDPEIRAAGSLAVADLNRDGTLDVVTVAEGIFASFLNLGRGAWSERRDHDIAGRGEGAPHLAGIATGDFDRDGDVDAAAAGGRFVFIAYNSGSGSLERGENPRVTGYPSCVASADFDDDGHQEIASTNSVPGALSVLWQSKEALSDVYKEQLILALGRPTALVTRDLDGDGDEDLVAASEGRTGGKAFFNRGDASFQEQAAFLEGRSLKAVAVEDFTGDGSPDVAATLGDGTSIALLPSLGLGQDPEPATLDAGVPCDGLVAGDLDRDEDFDLVAWSAAVREIRSFRNDGREPDGQSAWRLAATTRTALKPMVVSLGDLDGDGILDLIAGLDSDPPGPQYAILGSLYCGAI